MHARISEHEVAKKGFLELCVLSQPENVCFWNVDFSPFFVAPTLFFLPSPLLFFFVLGGGCVEVYRGR